MGNVMQTIGQTGAQRIDPSRPQESRRFAWLLLVALLGLFALPLPAPAADAPYVPPQLEPWVDWVLHNHPNLQCPRGYASGQLERCVWVSNLDVDVAETGSFTMGVRVFAEGAVVLPGNPRLWPQAVRVNGAPAQVLGKQQPKLVLPPGEHRISGQLQWQRRPVTIQIPQQFGLLGLRIDGKPIARPTVRNNQLVLGSARVAPTKATRNSLAARVFRLLRDDYPMTLTTTVELEVGGRARLVTLGQALLDGFRVTGFNSSQPARLDASGNLLVQVTPGNHRIVIEARAVDNPVSFKTNATTDNWPTQEIWGFVPQRDLRLVTLSGAPAIDLVEANAPFDEGNAQGYLMEPGTVLALSVQQRGNPNPPPNQYSLTRQLWLSFAGDAYVVNDRIIADIKQASRLSATYPLGRIDVDGEAELVNSLAGSEPGIEMQIGRYDIEAVSQLPIEGELTATGWQLDAQSLNATLNLPPGWRLLWVRGADVVQGAWLERWNLWDVFLVVFATVLAARFLSRTFAALVAVSLVLIVQSQVSLAILWLVGIGLVAGVRVIRHERFLRYFTGVTWVWLGITFLTSVGFAVEHAREAVYPQLEQRGYQARLDDVYPAQDSAVVTGSFTSEASVSDLASPNSRAQKARRPESLRGDKIEEIVVTATSIHPKKKYNEDTQIQTGPGQPDWSWNRARFSWNGPVSANQPLSLALASPVWVRIGNAACAALALLVSVLLVLALLPASTNLRLPKNLAALVPGLFALALLGPSLDAAAQALPTNDLLKDLEQRLLAAPECFPDCATLASAEVALADGVLTLGLIYHSQALVSVPLATSQAWSPSRITIAAANDAGAVAAAQPAVLAGTASRLTIALPAGIHRVQMTGAVSHLERFELNWPLTPGAITARVPDGWVLSGLVQGRIARGALSFERDVKPSGDKAEDDTLTPDPAAAFVTVDRTFDFGLEWTVTTRVRRVAPAQGSFSIRLPLLPNEAVIDANIAVDADSANLEFGRNSRQFRWTSRLPTQPNLVLAASERDDRRERWVLLPSNLWHLEYSGLVPVVDGDARGPTFRPYQGEAMQVNLTATTPIPGATVTVDNVRHEIEPGDRQRLHSLELSLRASLGGSYAIDLPAGEHTLVEVLVDGEETPLSLAGNQLLLPQVPGETIYDIRYRTSSPLGVLFNTQPPSLASPANNLVTEVTFPRDRWVLMLGGPALGPAMLYWGMLAVVVLLALALVAIPGLPLTRRDAIFLSLGLSLCNLPATLLVAMWLLLLRFRSNLMALSERSWLKNTLQVGVALVSAIALFQLVSSVPYALLGTPDMQITGNESSSHYFRWFNDHSAGELNHAWVVSLPLWVYRAAMLAWSLWLAFALIRWSQWAWQSFSQPAMWYRDAPNPATNSEAST